jgi:UDP-N-acetylglucosamine transferase subunit ALG13
MKKCFVTVGTTNFDALIAMIDTKECLRELNKKACFIIPSDAADTRLSTTVVRGLMI